MTFQRESEEHATSTEFYASLVRQAKGLIEGERNYVANCANVASLVYTELNRTLKNSQVNWVGFYLMDPSASSPELILGPFMGEPACIRIRVGKGVCGSVAEKREALLVDDVHAFPGHIACDSRSQSELVLPLIDPASQKLLGVMDLDSLVLSGFTEEDRQALEQICQALVETCDWRAVTQE